MVMHLPLPAYDDAQLVEDVVAERVGGKNAKYFKEISAEWRKRVERYVASGGSPAAVSRWQEIEVRKGSFLNLYLHPKDGSVQGKILEALRDHKLSLCPACGELGSPNTLDHYLPKGKYPHLCVTPANLIPMCDACQLAKLEKVGDATQARFFLHPYFDVFVGHRVIELKIETPFDSPQFDLVPAPQLLPAEYVLVKSHMKELLIETRFAVYFGNQYRRLLRLVGNTRAAAIDVRTTLRLFADSVADPTPNSWESVFYTAVLSNPDLMTYLVEGRLPDFP
jgi:5-methylcytosine-specific restriction endonuclease McrA